MTDSRDLVAEYIREFDPDNTLVAGELGKCLGIALAPQFKDLYADEVWRFVIEVDPGKRWSPDELAIAIVDHFKLDQEI